MLYSGAKGTMTPNNRFQRTALPRRRWGSGERQRVELRAAPPGGFALDSTSLTPPSPATLRAW